MIYVFDTSSFREMETFYPEIFESVWTKINEAVKGGILVSTREVYNEIPKGAPPTFFLEWLNSVKSRVFLTPDEEETQFVSEIFKIEHFQALVSKKTMARGNPVADPFVIACAKVKKGTVVTEEKQKDNAAKIPNVCARFDIPCTNLNGFMRKLGWKF
jgi:hypothetical protein